jgi:uncharacterized phage-like protein YoqJ
MGDDKELGLNMASTACFTGHRPEKLGGYDKTVGVNVDVCKFLSEAVTLAVLKGYDTFISGGALGVDQWAADEVLRQKQRLVIALPFETYGENWPPSSQKVLADLKAAASLVHVVCPGPYVNWKCNERNKWMVDRAAIVIAVYDGSKGGGTAHAVKYAGNKRVLWRYDPITKQADYNQSYFDAEGGRDAGTGF